MQKFKVTVLVIFGLLMASSFAYAGSYSSTSTKFNSGDTWYKAYDSAGYYLPGNCVRYVRWLVKAKDGNTLPGSNLNDLSSKKAICTKTDYSNLKKKCVVAINVGSVGHLAYVADIDNSGSTKSITLYEANYPSTGEYKRVLKGKDYSLKQIAAKYKIVGYWKP
jgi:hypothetical protein